jgi:hypothetical protein
LRSIASGMTAVGPTENLNQRAELYNDSSFNQDYVNTQKDTADRLGAMFDDYFTNWFPLDDSYAQAKGWVQDVLQIGGSGINANIEAQIWNRDRSRILEDSGRAEDEAISSWAARRFPTPPGAATYQLLMIRKDAQAKIAEVSRTAAIKSFETEIENIRIAVGRAIEFQDAVLNNAEKFFRIQLFPETYGHELENARFDIRGKFLKAATDLYSQQFNTFEKTTHADRLTSLDDERRHDEMKFNERLDRLHKRVEAAMAEAQSLATQASAALNALHAQASVSGNDSTVTNV